MNCPRCGHSVSQVKKTRDKATDAVSRRRECRACGYRFTTEERINGRSRRVHD